MHTFWECLRVQAESNSRVDAGPGEREEEALRGRLVAFVEALRVRGGSLEGIGAEEVVETDVVEALSAEVSIDVSVYEPDSPPLLRPLSPPSSRGGHRAS